MTNIEALQLLKESILTCGEYTPSTSFNEANSVAIRLGDNPILLLGWDNDQNSHDIADRLLNNPDFYQLINHEYGCADKLNKAIVANSKVCPLQNYQCITKSKQGVSEDGTGSGLLVAVLPDNNKALAFGLCVSNSLMQCFYPEANPLSFQISLNN